MTPLQLIALLSEAAKMTSIIAERLAKSEITPEEAMQQWQETAARWANAKNSWQHTEAPNA